MTRRRDKDKDDRPDDPGPFGGSEESPPPPKKKGADPRFPFGETSSDAGGLSTDSDASDLGRLLESDDPHLRPDASDSSGELVMADTGEVPPERPNRKLKSTGMREKLPADPPGSRPEDDASLDGLEEDEGSRASGSSEEIIALAGGASDQGPLENVSVTERIGQVGPSGPIVIVPDDEGADASVRYQASVVDDSARVAGSVEKEPRKPKKKKTGKRPAEWSGEDEPDPDAAVPTLSARRSARTSGERIAPPPPPPRGRAALLLLLGLLLGSIAAAMVQELRWRDIERRRAAEAEAQLAAARGEGERELAAAKGDAKQAAEEAARRLAEAEAARAAAAGEAEAEAARREARARAEEQQKVADAQAGRVRAEEALEVEVAAARRTAQEAVEEAVARAVEEEKGRGQVALEELARSEERKRREELEALRTQLQGELQGAVTRAEEEALARQLAESRKADLDQVAPPGGGGGGGGDEFDDLFADAPSSGGTGGGGEEDLFGDGDAEEKVGLIEQAWRWARKNIHGYLAYKNLSHFSRSLNRDARKTRHELRARLSYADWLAKTEDGLTGLRLVATLDFRVDDDDFANDFPDGVDDEQDTRPHVWPEELYLGLVHDWLEVRAGWQRFAWGTGDLLNPTDNLNPLDFSDLFDARRISVFAASARVQLDPFAIEVVSIPTFTRSRLPLPGKRFDLLRNSPITITRPDDPDGSLENVQWGARAVVRKFGWDVSLSAFTGYEDIPSADLNIISVLPPIAQATTRFDRLHVLGADFATTLGFLGLDGGVGELLAGIQLHGEAGYFIHEGPRLDDYIQYVIGFNYQFVDLIREHDLTVIVEYAGDYQLEAADQPFPGVDLGRIFRGGFLARLAYDVSEELSFELTGGVITHGRENGLIHPAVIWDPTDWLTLELAGDVFFGPDDTFFGQFKRDGRVLSTIKLNF